MMQISDWETLLDTLEEREARLDALRRAKGKLRKPVARADPESLRRALEDQPYISAAELRELARAQQEGAVISLYLSLRPDRLLRGRDDRRVLVSVANSLLHQQRALRREFVDRLPHAQRLRLDQDLAEIEAFLEELEPRGARALSLFKSGSRLNRVMLLPVRTADAAAIDVDPYVEPLEVILEQNRPVLVVEISGEEGRLLIHQLGHEEEVDRIRSSVPSRRVDAGRPGKAQRHRLAQLYWHCRSVAEQARRVFEEHRCELLILVGEEWLLHQLESLLAPHLRAALVGRIKGKVLSVEQRRAEIEEILARHRRALEQAAVAELSELQSKGRLVSGLEAVLEAANFFSLRRLLVGRDLHRPGYLCREHHWLDLEAGTCPLCGRQLESSADVVDELIEYSRLHGVEVVVFEQAPELLSPHGGVAGVTYPLPQARAAAAEQPPAGAALA